MSLSEKNKYETADAKYPQAYLKQYVEDDFVTRTKSLFFAAKRNKKLFLEVP